MPPQLTGYPVDNRFSSSPITQPTRLDALRKVSMFKGVSKRNLVLIDRLSEVRSASTGEVVFAQGDVGTEMMVVLDGKASVTRGQRELTQLSGGQLFGEMALLDSQTRSATVTAVEPMRMLVIPGPAFRKLLTKVPALNDAVLATLSTRLREADAVPDL
jgi:CRP/FNR family transcriptional regulator, cyclic AMP receptor protein